MGANVSAVYAPLATPTFTGTVTLPDGATHTSTGLTMASAKTIVLGAGSSLATPLRFLTGSAFLATPTAGAVEFDGSSLYITGDTTNGSGRQLVLAAQYGNLATAASVASGGAFFTATVRPALLAGHLYRFGYDLKFTKTTAGTITSGLGSNFMFTDLGAATTVGNIG